MKNSAIVFVLLALLACTGLMAQAPAPTPAVTAAPLPTATADFLATLSAAPDNAPAAAALQPAPTFLQSTTCTSSSQCPTGQLCCYPCGIDGCSFVCMDPVRGHCPFFP